MLAALSYPVCISCTCKAVYHDGVLTLIYLSFTVRIQPVMGQYRTIAASSLAEAGLPCKLQLVENTVLQQCKQAIGRTAHKDRALHEGVPMECAFVIITSSPKQSRSSLLTALCSIARKDHDNHSPSMLCIQSLPQQTSDLAQSRLV